MALLALAVQIVLSVGHIHFYALGLASANAASPAVAQDAGTPLPSKPGPIHKSDGVRADCAICALIQLSTTSAPAAAPALPPPESLGLIGLQTPRSTGIGGRAAFSVSGPRSTLGLSWSPAVCEPLDTGSQAATATGVERCRSCARKLG